MDKSFYEPIREIRDPVHGFVKLSPAEIEIVNSPTFQRLRDIRQLAVAHYVYPGATHTRFEHSIGCVHLATQIFDTVMARQGRGLSPTVQDAFATTESAIKRGRDLVRLAALLHDLGHGPFSHSGEHVMPTVEVGGEKIRLTHEHMTATLIRETEIGEKIEKFFGSDEIHVQDVISVATDVEAKKSARPQQHSWYSFLNEIITGELGADRMDYLVRDSLHSGQPSGRFDYMKLVDSMTIVEPPAESLPVHRLGVDDGGWLVAEQMVACRYLMYVALYFHKTKRVLEKHMEAFLPEWLQARLGQPFLPAQTPTEYVKITESPVWASVFEAARDANAPGHRHARAFANRDHYRLAIEFLPSDLRDAGEGKGSTGEDPSPVTVENTRRFDKLAQVVRIKYGDGVIVDEAGQKAAGFFRDDPGIWVSLRGKTRYLTELSEIVRGMARRIWRGRVFASPEIRTEVENFCRTQAGLDKEDDDGRLFTG